MGGIDNRRSKSRHAAGVGGDQEIQQRQEPGSGGVGGVVAALREDGVVHVVVLEIECVHLELTPDRGVHTSNWQKFKRSVHRAIKFSISLRKSLVTSSLSEPM